MREEVALKINLPESRVQVIDHSIYDISFDRKNQPSVNFRKQMNNFLNVPPIFRPRLCKED